MRISPVPNNTSSQLRALLDAAVDGIIIINDAGEIIAFNHAAERLFGYAVQEVTGKNVSLLMPEPHRSQHDSYLQTYKQTGNANIIGIGREVLAQHKDGSTFPVYLSIGETHIDSRWCFVGILHDLTKRKQIEAELQEQKALLTHTARLSVLGEMTAGIAHEINQPLTAIATYAQACKRMLDNDQYNRNEISDTLGLINEQAIRAGDVIHRLRKLASRQDSERIQCSINELVYDVVGFIVMDVHTHDIVISTDLDDSLPDVIVDVIQIQQVLLNLINNSIDALRECETQHKHVIIYTSMPCPDEIQVQVKDNANGVPVHMNDALFKPFYTSKTYGMGIGLSICRSIIHSHGGRLELLNTSDNGSTFAFSLPIIPELSNGFNQ